MTDRRCKICLVNKPIEEFHRNPHGVDGYASRCKECYKEYYQAHKKKADSSGVVDIQITQTLPQKKFTENDKKFRAYVGGVGCGKTAAGWHNTLKQAFTNPGSLGVIVAPTYSSIRDVILRERVQWIPEDLISNYNKTDKEMTFINGSTILFRSAKDETQIERLRGLSIGWGWIDEATLLPKLVLDILTARLRQPGSDDYKLWLTCTPRKGWLYDMVQDGLDDEWFMLDNIESSSNIYLPEGYTDSLKTLYTGQFYDQEVLGKWVDFEGLIWQCKQINEEKVPAKLTQTYYGIDIGWEHPSSIIVIQKQNDIFYVVDEFYEQHTHDSDVAEVLGRMWKQWGSGRAFVDPSVPRTIKFLNNASLTASGANNKVFDGLRTVRALLDTGKLFISTKCINLIREMEEYVWKDGGKEVPVDINDDACDALRYGIMGATGTKVHKSSGVVRGK